MSDAGSICTFYSYKGGVGRSMALANVAALLARWGRRVLVVDWDLEAPGIERYFLPWMNGAPRRPRGVIDLMEACATGKPLDWRPLLETATEKGCEDIHILSAGKGFEDDGSYAPRLRALAWDEMFEENDLGQYLEDLRDQWKAEYDFVLVDSRTGITDIGGICTIHLPDTLVSFFTANDQSLEGVRDVMTSAREGHGRLPVDRRRLLAVPVPSRDESGSEYELAEEWRRKFAEALAPFFDDWVPTDEKPELVLDFLKIPYFAYWSFGERIPVFEEKDPDNPKTLAFAYQPLARLLMSALDWSEARVGGAATEAAREHEAKAEEAKLRQAELEEKAEQRKRAEAQAKDYIEARVLDQIRYLRIRASGFRLRLLLIITLGSVAALVALALGVYQVTFELELAKIPEQTAPPEPIVRTEQAFAFIGVAGGLAALMLYLSRALRYGQKRAIALEGAARLEKMRHRFLAVFPGEDPEITYRRFVDEVEELILETSDALEHPAKPFEPQGPAGAASA